MDPNEKDERKPQRQELLARRLGEALDQIRPHGAEVCPDAEIIAAYAERALGPTESAECEVHFGACARCRNILRVLTASADTPLAEKEVAHLGELVSVVPDAVEINKGPATRTRPKIGFGRMRWLAPAFGVAAVLVVWLVMRPPWRATNRGGAETLIAQAPKEEIPANPPPQALDQLSRAAPPENEKSRAVAPGNPPASVAPQNPSAEALKKERSGGEPNRDADSRTDSAQPEKQANRLQGQREIQVPIAPPLPPIAANSTPVVPAPAAPQLQAKSAPSTSPRESGQIQTATNAIGNTPAKDKQAETVQGAADAISGAELQRQKISPESQIGRRSEAAFALSAPMQQNGLSLLKAPSSSIVWRAGKGGSIERSTDAGKTWVAQASPSQEDWLAGAAISDSICWVVGRNGAIGRTVDGEHWRRIAPPQVVSPDPDFPDLPDWTGVTATDANTVAITARDGRKFSTVDTGKTWRQEPIN